ncbi:MAG TPA: hypothetical protein VMX94_02995 [Armatimonadota bacterium]|nr:hypothetical protein [Armatimonadota bacterium]
MEEPEVEEAAMAARGETGCDIDINAAKEEAAWYSIVNVLALNLGSGMGIPLEQNEMNSLLGKISTEWEDLPLRNPLPLKAIFKSGDPHLLKPFEQRNLGTWRWSPDSFDRTLSPQSHGWAVIAGTECAKWFGIPQSAEAVSEDLRREWRINGMLLCALARKQCDFAFDNLRNGRGLFVTAAEPGTARVTEAAANLEDQACMLWACSDSASLAGQAGSMCADADARRRYLNLADDLFQALADNKDSLLATSLGKALAQSVAIPALVWYASVTKAQDLKARCLWLLREFADNLVRAQDANEMVGDTVVDAAAALRALTEAFRVTRLRTYAETATKIFNFIESQWWKLPGVYSQTPLSTEYTYNADDVGIICGALDAGRLFLKDRVDRDLAELRMRIFFCKAVNISGLQMSMPSPDFMPVWLQEREPAIHFRHGSVPLPSEADGDFGIAPVFAGEAAYDPQSDTWSRRMIFDAPAAMHACCEFLWLNREAVNGFPEIVLEGAPLRVRRAAGAEG